MAEVAQVAAELATAPQVEQGRAPVGLVFDYTAAWAWTVQPQGAGCDYFRLVFEIYRGLRKLGLSIDILAPDTADLGAYPLVLVPGAVTLRPALRDAISRAPGQVLLGPRTNAKTEDLSIPVPLPPAITDLPVTVSHVETLRPDMPTPLAQGGAVKLWREHLETGAQILETDDASAPVLVQQGTVSYLGGWPDDTALARILTRAATQAGLTPEPLPQDIRIRDTGQTRFIFNHGPEPVAYQGQTIPSAGFLTEPL